MANSNVLAVKDDKENNCEQFTQVDRRKRRAFYAGYKAGLTGKLGCEKGAVLGSYAESLAWLEGWLEGVEVVDSQCSVEREDSLVCM